MVSDVLLVHRCTNLRSVCSGSTARVYRIDTSRHNTYPNEIPFVDVLLQIKRKWLYQADWRSVLRSFCSSTQHWTMQIRYEVPSPMFACVQRVCLCSSNLMSIMNIIKHLRGLWIMHNFIQKTKCNANSVTKTTNFFRWNFTSKSF